jgi:hypothetical protein
MANPFQGWDPDVERPVARKVLDRNLSHEEPLFTAWTNGDDFVDAGDDLPRLLDGLKSRAEDLAVWRCDGVLAAVIVKGQVTTFATGPVVRRAARGNARQNVGKALTVKRRRIPTQSAG